MLKNHSEGMEDNDSVEEELNALYSEIESEFGKAPDRRMRLRKLRSATHKMDSRAKLENSLDKLRDKNVASMQRFIADARNQAFRDELSLDLDEGYQIQPMKCLMKFVIKLNRRILQRTKRGLKTPSRTGA